MRSMPNNDHGKWGGKEIGDLRLIKDFGPPATSPAQARTFKTYGPAPRLSEDPLVIGPFRSGLHSHCVVCIDGPATSLTQARLLSTDSFDLLLCSVLSASTSYLGCRGSRGIPYWNWAAVLCVCDRN